MDKDLKNLLEKHHKELITALTKANGSIVNEIGGRIEFTNKSIGGIGTIIQEIPTKVNESLVKEIASRIEFTNSLLKMTNALLIKIASQQTGQDDKSLMDDVSKLIPIIVSLL